LWHCCNNTAGNSNIYQYLDNQVLADVIAGKFPVSADTDRRGAHFRFRDQRSDSRQAAIDRLRREIPPKGVVDILVDGSSWNLPMLKAF
jgi:hypothetical protein